MEYTAPKLALLSDAVLQLHRGSRAWPAPVFQARACELLASLVPFDACLWGSAPAHSAAGTALSLQDLYVQGMAGEALAQCLQGQPNPPALRAEQIEPLSARRVELQLWRLHSQAPATAAEQDALQFLWPHLVETHRENRLSRASDNTAVNARSHALCAPDGTLLDLDAQCLALLRVEWPRWCPPALPEPLVAELHALGSDTHPFHGRQVTVLITRCGSGLLLEVRRRIAVDRLSKRQRDIAQLYAAGQTGAQIAAQLELAESTVNNHLGLVFKKLSVSNKVQLSELMRSGSSKAQ